MSKEQLKAIEQFMARTVFPLIYESPEGTAIRGTGSFFEKDNQIFIITAAHVLNGLDYHNFGIPEAPLGDVRIRTFDDFVIHKPNVENLDVAIIQLGAGLFVEEVVPKWNILNIENVDIVDLKDDSEFLIAGFPAENVEFSDNRLIPKSLFQFYSYQYLGEVEKGKGIYDLFMHHKKVVVNSENVKTNMVQLEGASGSPVWRLEETGKSIWAPITHLKLAGIQVSYKKNSYIRAKKWLLVDEIISHLDS